jgi:N-acyl amino acid synthase of PEP-CTERM/exosortase system
MLTPNFSFEAGFSTQASGDFFNGISKLRYEVYCEECHYLSPDDHISGRESDEHDRNSFHVAAYSSSGLLAGTVRLVRVPEDGRFPFEDHCHVFPEFKFPPRSQSGEVSRLIVQRSFRRRAGDTLQGVGRAFSENPDISFLQRRIIRMLGGDRRGSSPQIMLGLYREIYQYSLRTGCRYWYAAMERGLVELLRRMGFPFTPVGPEEDYYGPVATYLADLRQLEASLQQKNPILLAWFKGNDITLSLIVRSYIAGKILNLTNQARSIIR